MVFINKVKTISMYQFMLMFPNEGSAVRLFEGQIWGDTPLQYVLIVILMSPLLGNIEMDIDVEKILQLGKELYLKIQDCLCTSGYMLCI